MSNIYPIGTWVYQPVDFFTPDEVDTWKEFGLNVTLTPAASTLDEVRKLIPFFDKAEKEGLKLIANVYGLGYEDYDRLGEEKYREHFREVYNILKGHPALYGFAAGDEPSKKNYLEATVQCLRVMKEEAPELRPYINLMGGSYDFPGPDIFNGRTYEEWIKYLVDTSGVEAICYDAYGQTINDQGVTDFLCALRIQNEAIEKAGADPWITLLCSSHLVYHIPSEYENAFQINAAAACGCRGIIWFRMYDRDISPDYHGSPVDEFGYKTEHYYRIMRCQKRLTLHYGELLMKLKRKSTFMTGKDRGAFPMFTDGSHDLIKYENVDDTIISFFEDEDGREYAAIVNAALNINYTVARIRFDPEKCKVYRVILNGKDESEMTMTHEEEDLFLHPGQMAMIRIERK